MSLHPRNIEPLEGTTYLTCFLAWLGKGWGSGSIFPLCRKYLFLLQAPSSALHSFLQMHLPFPFDCLLTLWQFSSQIPVCPVNRLGNFAAPYCFCLHKWIFPGFPLGHVSGWHGFFFGFGFFFFVSLDRDGVWLSCRTRKVGGCSLVPAGLEVRPPLSLTVYFLLSHCLGWELPASVWKLLFLRSRAWVCPNLVIKPWHFRPSSGLEVSRRKAGLNPGLCS